MFSGGELERVFGAWMTLTCIISAVVGWAVIEGIIWIVKWLINHVQFV